MTDHKQDAAAGLTPLAAIPTVDTHGDEPMTDRQAVEMRVLTEKLGEPMDGVLTRRQAARRIAALKEMAGE